MLQHIFPKNHPLYNRIFWDPVECSYYDKSTDLFITAEDLAWWLR